MRPTKIGFFQIMMRLLGCALVLFPHYALAGQVNIPGFYGTVNAPSRTMLPQAKPQGVLQGATIDTSNASTQNQLVINQNQQNAIIDWSSFNIGADASVNFNQQGNATWSALNRIWDSNPSLIFGKLTADGKIYLINQNGILFGPGSTVNVNSLVVSALNIDPNDFLNNVLHFTQQDYQGLGNLDPLAIVANHGDIESNASSGGYVFLMAPRVENYGVINAPSGQIGLVGGIDVKLNASDDNNPARSYSIFIQNDFVNAPASTDADFGRVVNGASGKLYADGGVAGMYGNNIDQWGVVRSITAYRNNKGQVELMAANKITTGANSSIDLHVDDSVDPATGLPPTISDTFDIQPVVKIMGLSSAAAKQIDLGGSIIAPAGTVKVIADHVAMESTSSIDVSGAVKDLPVAVIADAKLTSVELRDSYDQKGGVLQGEKITTPVSSGSSIGDISQTLLSGDKTAWERLAGGDIRKHIVHSDTKGDYWAYDPQIGSITVTAANGDININQGASLNFSGGKINYQSGFVNTTKLLSGTQIYDISNAPVNVHYNEVLGNYEKTYDRFGVRESYSGIYYGGASSLKTYVQGYSVGGDAGSLSLTATKIILDGTLNGGVYRGTYQNAVPDGDNEARMLNKALGRETPKAGTLTLSASSISVVSETDHQTEMTQETTQLSAMTLNNAKLGTVALQADLTVSTAADAALTLQPGGTFSAYARLIDHEGKITVPGGEIDLVAEQNSTSQQDAGGSLNPNPVPLPSGLTERIILGKNSVLDVSGERIDNSKAGTTGNAVAASGRTTGGTINLKDETDQGAGVFVQSGAVVDVSGGYTIDQKGKLTGGNAGKVAIQGANIQLDGDLRGYALSKLAGGTITLSSLNSVVAPDTWIQKQGYTWSSFDPTDPNSSISSKMQGQFYLADNRFEDTGFTQITVNSKNDLTIQANTIITPSLVRLNNPAAVQEGTDSLTGAHAVAGRPDLIRLDQSMDYMAGPSKFAASAGVPFEGVNGNFKDNLSPIDLVNYTPLLLVSGGALVRTTPGSSSSISLSGPAVTVNGTLDSRSGTIKVNATSGNLLIGDGANILAKGYNKLDPSSTPNGYGTNYQPMDGGTVSLTASATGVTDTGKAVAGNLTIASRALIDVSGSDAVWNTVLSGGKITTYQTAGNPGSVSLNYGGTLYGYGNVVANRAKLNGLSGISGGSLAITYAYPDTANLSKADKLSIGGYIDYFLYTGFDDLTFKSNSTINLDGLTDASGAKQTSFSYVIPRKLTLDAPDIAGDGTIVQLSAPWIVLTNTSKLSHPSLGNTSVPTAGTLTLSGVSTDSSGGKHGGSIDVIGDIQFDSFKDVTLETGGDIRLSQVLYDDNYHKGQDTNHQGTVNPGTLRTTGNVVLDAARIYPGNYYEYDTSGSAIYPNVYSDYTVHADGKAIVQHTVDDRGAALEKPIYSAGGTLTIEGLGGIDVKKDVIIAAPMGSINLTTGASPASGSRIYLENGSTLTTAGNADVLYGWINPDNLWVVLDKQIPTTTTFLFTQDMLPPKGINLAADEVIIRQGAVTNVSGGGSVFAYKFQPGVEGSTDPLTKSGRYVVFAADSMPMPGTAIYLQGGGGLSAGMYTLLPLDAQHPQNARYAFMPGASIIEAQTGVALPGQGALSKDGYPLLVGYTAIADTSVQSARPQVYTVRTASEVLATEGSYVQPTSVVSGDAGNVTIGANSMILQGTFNAAALTGYQGGKISLAATDITVMSSSASLLPPNFYFGKSLDPALVGKLNMTGDTVQGFREVDLGDVDPAKPVKTDSITIKAGAQLSADVVSLSARKTANASLTLENGAMLTATTGDGGINLTTTGSLDIESNAVVHAAHAVTVDANDVKAMKGSLESDGGALTLKSSAIYFDDGSHHTDADTGLTDTGLHVTQTMWTNNFTGFQDITLQSNSGNNSGILFYKDFNLSAGNSLTLDASRIVNMNQDSVNQINVTLSAPTINVKNSGNFWKSSTGTVPGAATFTATANNEGGAGAINIGEGDVLFANFKTINLSSRNDLTLLGKGSLSTGNADLSINAARVTTASTSRTVNDTSDYIQTTAITAPDFVIYTGGNYSKDNDPNNLNGLNPLGSITINGNGYYKQSPAAGGGILEFWGNSIRIDNGGVIQADGGSIKMVAATGNIALNNNGQILAQGTSDAPGGVVALRADTGSIVMDPTSVIDVSAGYTAGSTVSQGDAGLISLQAPKGGVSINGGLKGNAQGGAGGSLIVDTYQVSNMDTTMINTDMTQLLGAINTGGFTESVDIRARTGDINIASGQTLEAHHVKLTADGVIGGGNIDIYGNMTAPAEGQNGGSIELYAQNNLTIESAGTIKAVSIASGSPDPNVLLSSTQGLISVNGVIDVSDNTGVFSGIVYLRAKRNDNNNDINASVAGQGSIVGANAVYAEAVRSNDFSQTTLDDEITAADVFYTNALANKTGLGSMVSNFHLLPGIELFSDSDINFEGFDLTSIKFGANPEAKDVPGVLTIRTTGNLDISGNLTDYPEYQASLNAGNSNPITSLSKSGRNSWGFNLVAGADLSSADTMAVNTNGSGNLSIDNYATVYTESAPIRFASGGNTNIGVEGQIAAQQGYMISQIMMNYDLASFSGSIRGNVGRDLTIAGAIQTATGDIDITVGRDLYLLAGSDSTYLGAGAIRTTGELSVDAASASMGQYGSDPKPIDPATGMPFDTKSITQKEQEDPVQYQWRYANGGNITLNVGGSVGKPDNSGKMTTADGGAWDYFTMIDVSINNSNTTYNYGLFSANYWYGTASLATMGGGNLSARTGGDFLAQAGTFGAGDLTIYSGGDIMGRFLNHGSVDGPGRAEIHATGNFGSFDKRTQIELFDSKMNVTARGEIQIGAVLNPDLASDQLDAYRSSSFVNCTYSPDTSISLNAGTDVTFAGKSPFYKSINANDNSARLLYEIILPATVDAVAGGNLYLLSDLTLASSSNGDLNLRAGSDVIGQVVSASNRPPQILVSDMAPENWYGLFSLAGTKDANNSWIGNRTIANKHGLLNPIDLSMSTPDSGPLHMDDSTPIVIYADRDIKNLKLMFPKKAEVTAGRDIADITYDGQNIGPDDISMIRAGRDISMKYGTTFNAAAADGLTQGGPGTFLVQAGDSIDLGSLAGGIQEIGNGNNAALSAAKSSLILLSGYSFDGTSAAISPVFTTAADVGAFFSAISSAGDKYAKLMADGKLDDAAQLLRDTRNKNITPLLVTASGAGDINMTSSQISTSNAASGVFIIANGNLNLGKTALPSATVVNTTSGISTANGGSINIFAVKDINVQESRVMTFFSQQDMVDPSSAYGDITVWSDSGNINAGRGSRTAVSASPPKLVQVPGQTGVYRMVFTPPAVGSGIRALTYGENPPDAGNVHLFAPTGVIDAGEAGIAGNSVTLAALKITNASNISFSAGSIGVPQQSAAATNLGTLAGSGITQNTQVNADASGMSAAKVQAAQMVEDIIAKWLDVKVVDFIEDDNKEE